MTMGNAGQFIFMSYSTLSPFEKVVKNEMFGFDERDLYAFLPQEEDVLSDESYPALFLVNERTHKAISVLNYACKQFLMGVTQSQKGQMMTNFHREEVAALFHMSEGFLKSVQETKSKNDFDNML